ncbi:hypothetical protein CsSME_00017211 [Camellia sinensis var. sinensis]
MCTRPDICYAVGLVSRYQSNPGPAHWKAVKRILRYLKGTADYTLCYQSSDLHLVGYCDADWGGDLDERKSTSGYAFMLSDGAISWSSKKQSCIALSTMEAEFVACSSVVQEAVWLRRFLQHLDVVTHTSDPVTIHCDSMAALAYAKDPKYHGRTKHIDLRFNFIRDILAQKEAILEHIPTSRMVADPLTKHIARDVYLTHVRALGLRKIGSLTRAIALSPDARSHLMPERRANREFELDARKRLVRLRATRLRSLMFSYFGMLPAVMYDSALRDITGKAVNFKLNDMRSSHMQVFSAVARCGSVMPTHVRVGDVSNGRPLTSHNHTFH